jgi:organic hydroperoxide reductase OsmC/OhrA
VRSGASPEEVIAAAQAGCFVMQFARSLAENAMPATSLNVIAVVELIPGTDITGSALTVDGKAGPTQGRPKGMRWRHLFG